MPTPLTELLSDPSALGKVTRAIHSAVSASLKSHPLRHVTEAEIKRRFDVCLDGFRSMRMDQKLSIDRCSDEIPKVLRASLDGVHYIPHSRSVWLPEDRT